MMLQSLVRRLKEPSSMSGLGLIALGADLIARGDYWGGGAAVVTGLASFFMPERATIARTGLN